MKVERLPLGEVQANTYILRDEETGEIAIIDCGECTPSLLERLEKHGLDNVKYIILTHGHFDHIFGVPELKKLTGAPVLIHENDADCLYDEMRSLAYRHFPDEQVFIKADGFLGEGDVLKLGEQEIRVLHTPGHSKGSVCLVCADMLFTGDTLFCRTVGRTDFPDGDFQEMMSSIKKLINLEGDYIVYPGHNRSTTLDIERKTNRFLRNKDVFTD